MKKNLYLFLIIFFILLIPCLIFKKDFGYDKQISYSYKPLLGLVDNVAKYTNKTINNVDYLQTSANIGKFGSKYVSSVLGDPKTFNPYNASDATSAELSEMMYEGLVQTDPISGNVIMKLAKSIEVMPDKLTYIVHLRKGIKWSDGVELNADDVYFTYNTVIFGGFGDGASRDVMMINSKLPTIKKIDNYTVLFKTPQPFAPFLRNLSSPILPKHVFEKVTKKGNEYFLTYQGIDADINKIVYSGAFHLAQYIPSQRIIFKKNPNYYLINKNNEKLPYLDEWIMLVCSDLNNQTLKFESGEIDTLSINGSLLNRYRELQKRSDFDIYNLGPTTNTTFIVFNLNNRKNKKGKYYVNPVKQKWFQDKNFRTAIDYAINRDDLILNIYSGLASPLFTAEPVNSLFVNEKLKKGHKRDLAYAKKLLEKSGFYFKENKLFDKYNNRVEFELLTNAGNTQREATGVCVKQDLEHLGIKVNFKAIEFNSLINKISNTLDFDCAIIALTSNINEPNSGFNVWKKDGSLHLFNKRTLNDDKNSDKPYEFEEKIEDLFKKGALELNFIKRKEIYNQYQQIVSEEKPLIYLYSPLNIVAIRKKFKNIFPTTLGGLIYSLSIIYDDNI